MKEAASPAKTDANNRQAGAQRESHAVALPPLAYGIDFLDRHEEKESPAAQGERLAPGLVYPWARLTPEQQAARQVEPPKPAGPAKLQPQPGKAAKAAHEAVAPKPAVKRLPSQPAPQPALAPVAVPAAASADAAPAPTAESGAMLAEEPAATPEEQKTQDKLEAASPESAGAGEPVDMAASTAEPEPPAELEPPVAPPVIADEMAVVPPPADDAGAAQALPQPAAQEQSLQPA